MLPPSPDRSLVSPADLAQCRQMIRDGSKTFYTASLLLPQRVCDASRSLYGFCRVADDLVDRAADPRAAVDTLLARLDRIYRGAPDNQPADRAFADVALRFAIPREIPEALIEGFAWDAGGRRYRTLDELHAYAVRVAGTVGAMMSLVMQVRDASAIARACDLGVAMQLTNIARDVGEDARNARLYLPLDWLYEESLDAESFLAAPRASMPLSRVLKRLLAEADRLYARSLSGIAMLPPGCRPSIHAARLLYAEIGRAVEMNGHDSVTRRATVATPRKLALLARAVTASLTSAPRSDAPAIASAQFLIDAVATAGQPIHPPRTLDERAQWLTELFTRLEKQGQ
ncbi:phytoene/squalene synthase family protein [Aestuariivirga sp.]|uniref:phytoene/squalene synthase family protein n=1 Tax=Aestuariivirga sp. TaxID=2650926 RepID=UPI0025C5680D|nr:phytoene/squalene synthase family protein [Aestuariivirga sp.]MCA3555520.1 phytoene/squalene synthase family protein [Aestuariivirga sp.]